MPKEHIVNFLKKKVLITTKSPTEKYSGIVIGVDDSVVVMVLLYPLSENNSRNFKYKTTHRKAAILLSNIMRIEEL